MNAAASDGEESRMSRDTRDALRAEVGDEAAADQRARRPR